MSTSETDEGIEITWKVPVVAKGERLDVSFEIKGEGEIDAEALNRFHGAHFGDELETEDDAVEQEVEEVSEESSDGSEDTPEETEAEVSEAEEKVPEIKFREDIMLRVMEEYGITDRDAFLAHSMNFDLDDNGYLKKAEFVEAAKAFTAEAGESEESESEEASADASSEESADESDKDCPICGTSNAHDAASCTACNYTFV